MKLEDLQELKRAPLNLEGRRFFTVGEVAEDLRVHPATILRWVYERRIKTFQPRPGSLHRISREEYECFLHEYTA